MSEALLAITRNEKLLDIDIGSPRVGKIFIVFITIKFRETDGNFFTSLFHRIYGIKSAKIIHNFARHFFAFSMKSKLLRKELL